MKLAVLSNVNMEPLKTFFPESVFSGYNQYMAELISHGLIKAQAPETVWLHLEAREMAGDLYYQLPKEADTLLAQAGQWMAQLRETAHAFPKISFVVSSLVFPPRRHTSYLAQDGVAQMEEALNRRLAEVLRDLPNALVLDIKPLLLARGFDQILAPRFWYLGRIPYTHTGFELLSRALTQALAAHKGQQKKVLVLDLDNTLWGGVVGEDGVSGIALSEDGMGKAYRDFQREIKAQQDKGVLLALCSKNNEADALEVLETHPMMVLKKEDFVAMEINWEPKAANIQRMANQLSLGLESFVFIDDNPVEREMVQTTLPQVTVPDFPTEPTLLPSWFLDQVVYPCFPRHFLTREDQDKTAQYKKRSQRQALSQNLDMDAFIQSLDIRLTVLRDPTDHVQRLAQMTQKTNQFNPTTRRYTQADIQAFIADPQIRVLALDYQDKFGKEGIVGLTIVRLEGDTADVDSFLLSCRVIGRRVEDRLFAALVKEIAPNAATLTAHYIPTEKNPLVADLYPRLGLTPDPDTPNRYTGKISSLIKEMETD